jgi:archaellum component FlaF (FlaF/FlaG flagellin family)
MTYTITLTQDGDKFAVQVQVLDGETVLLTGNTSVIVPLDAVTEALPTQEAVARDYAERVFLADLRKNFRAIRSLVLPSDPVVGE